MRNLFTETGSPVAQSDLELQTSLVPPLSGITGYVPSTLAKHAIYVSTDFSSDHFQIRNLFILLYFQEHIKCQGHG